MKYTSECIKCKNIQSSRWDVCKKCGYTHIDKQGLHSIETIEANSTEHYISKGGLVILSTTGLIWCINVGVEMVKYGEMKGWITTGLLVILPAFIAWGNILRLQIKYWRNKK